MYDKADIFIWYNSNWSNVVFQITISNNRYSSIHCKYTNSTHMSYWCRIFLNWQRGEGADKMIQSGRYSVNEW